MRRDIPFKSMKRIRFLSNRARIAIIILFAPFEMVAFAQFPQPEEITKSVVRVEVMRNKEKAIGTGFAWGNTTFVVTALHVVAGAEMQNIIIKSQRPNAQGSSFVVQTSGVKNIRVYYLADLALLELTEEIGLVPLRHADPNIDQDHEIWGFPKSIPELKSDRIRFSKGVLKTPTFKALMNQEMFEREVGGDGFPLFDAQILRISDTIQHGHSGAPIVNSRGQVVGIADGGLYEGIRRINWAIPAAKYLPELERSTEKLPRFYSKRRSQMSAIDETGEVPESILLGSEVDLAGHPPADPSNTDPAEEEEYSVLEWVWSATLSDILESVDEQDLAEYENLIYEASENTGADLRNAVVDVYEDPLSGATLALPAEGVSAQFDEENQRLEVWSEGSAVEMIIQIQARDSWDEAIEDMEAFDADTDNLYEQSWSEDPDEPDIDPEYSQEDEYWYWEKARIIEDENGNPISSMLSILVVDETNFLGSALILRDIEALTPQDERIFFLMAACIGLSNFPID